MWKCFKSWGLSKEEVNKWKGSLENLLQPPVVGAGVARCFLILPGPLLNNGKLTVPMVTNGPWHRLWLCWALKKTASLVAYFLDAQVEEIPGGFPRDLYCALLQLHHILYSFTPPLLQVSPDNARAGTFCSKLIIKECYQTALKRVFSDVGSSQLGEDSWKIRLSLHEASLGCISLPVLSY
jgi:hypothetical protein